jgi:hypothetical protein
VTDFATAVWQGLDAPRMEIAHLAAGADAVEAHGTQIGVTYELRYLLRGRVLDIEIVGERSESITLGEEDFFDVGYSPLFNSLPVLRDDLLRDGAAARDYTMLWVSVPDLRTHRSLQRYTPLDGNRVLFHSGTYRAEVAFDADGLARSYEGLASRLA